MTELIKVLYTKLATLTTRVYSADTVPQTDVTFPYISFKAPTTNDIERMTQVIIEIDIWDKKKSGYDAQTAIEALTDTIEKGLEKYAFKNINIAGRFEKVTRLSFGKDPDDENLLRRQLRIEARTFIYD